MKPGFYFRDAVGKGRERGRSDGFGGNVELGVVGKAVKLKSMMVDYLTKRKTVQNKEEGAKN